MDPALLALVACPRCGARLTPTPAGTGCSACQVAFPEPGGVPCLLPEPARAMDGWRRDVQRLLELIERGVAAMDEQGKRVDLLPATRQRLERMSAAQSENGARVAALFRDAGLAPDARAKAAEQDLSLVEYYDQILRDWAWDAVGGQENAQACELVAAAIGDDHALGRVLVLGAGPARLAHDLHRRFTPAITVAVDLNPLLLLAAQKVLHGGGLQLYEFPVDPAGLDSILVDHTLRPPAPAPPGLHLVLADAFTPPFAAGSFDTVVTPWFIDIVPADVRDSIALIHRLLAPQGRWLHYGPLSYPQGHEQARRYTYQELYQLVALGAFEMGPPRITRIDYMRSPAAARGKTADVLTFAARRLAPVPASPDQDPPPWLLLGHLPIPRWPGLEGHQPEHPLLGFLAGLIDDQRTLGDLATRMVTEHGARPDAALEGTRAMLTLLWQSTRR
jgi:uncharacterized protein YbaR (Trm112 family)